MPSRLGTSGPLGTFARPGPMCVGHGATSGPFVPAVGDLGHYVHIPPGGLPSKCGQAQERTISQLVILGGGTAGTMIADKLWPRLDRTDWNFMVVDRDDQHHYPPGYLFLGGTKRPKPVTSG